LFGCGGRGRGCGRLLFRVLFETLVNAKWRSD
jgi:hypothetical protein